MPALNQHGEVCDLLDVNQFQPGRSVDECVCYASVLIKFAGLAGHGPTGSVLEASNLAQFWYGKETGSTSASNHAGLSLSQEYAVLQGLGLHFWGIAPTVEAIKATLAQGVPCLMCGAETGMVDVGLGDKVPYNWVPTGNHCIVISGIAHDGNLLVHDTANIDASGRVRPGPRTYDASKLQIVSATAVMVPGSVIQPATQSEALPAGWHDDGTTLTAPNGVQVQRGFRAHVLPLLTSGKWNPANVPLAPEQSLPQLLDSDPSVGAGAEILFKDGGLIYTAKDGVQAMPAGQELAYYRQKYAAIYKEHSQLIAWWNALQEFQKEHPQPAQ